MAHSTFTANLFPLSDAIPSGQTLADGAFLLRGFANPVSSALLDELEGIVDQAPFRHLVTPGGFTMSVATTNCGQAGWTSDRRGYRYAVLDGISGKPWPAMPKVFMDIACHAAARAGYANFHPDSCLINCYEPGTRLTLHQDKNERDFSAPIVSVSLGLPAIFLFGGATRNDRPQRHLLEHGDVAVWGGPARLNFHGIMPLKEGNHPLLGHRRINLTFREAL
jgi:alkylated DNA repair protein (DNA oxidative demethylase)